MIAEFVLIVSMSAIPTDLKYVGNFVDCKSAQEYLRLNLPDVKESRCLLQKYMYLPDNFKKRIITIDDGCKLRRECNEQRK